MALELGSALLFVGGCVAFYAPSRQSAGVTLFLLGSLLMLASVVGRLVLKYGPSE